MGGTGTGTPSDTLFITYSDLKTEMGITVATSDTLLAVLTTAVLDLWDELTDRTWASTEHTAVLDGKGSDIITLPNYPVTILARLATGKQEAIKITNTAESTSANVAVTSTGLVLTKDGTSDSTVLFATYTTISTVVSAVNALGNSWSAEVITGYDSYKSSELLQMFSANVIDSNYAYLSIPDTYYDYDEFTIDSAAGIIYAVSEFPIGYQNIYITYTAGYTGDTVPSWLKQTLIRQGCHWFRQARDESWHINSKSLPASAGSVYYKTLRENLLDDFMFQVMKNRRITI